MAFNSASGRIIFLHVIVEVDRCAVLNSNTTGVRFLLNNMRTMTLSVRSIHAK